MSAFAQWLIGFADTFLAWLYNSAVSLLQIFSDTLVDFIISVVSLFPVGSSMPQLPAAPTGGTFVVFLQTLNWLFPVFFMVQLITWVASGMLLYLVIAPLARWFKLLT
ncbi:MAG: hypothetical protein WBI04_09795 [Trichlorobacter sp.]